MRVSVVEISEDSPSSSSRRTASPSNKVRRVVFFFHSFVEARLVKLPECEPLLLVSRQKEGESFENTPVHVFVSADR